MAHAIELLHQFFRVKPGQLSKLHAIQLPSFVSMRLHWFWHQQVSEEVAVPEDNAIFLSWCCCSVTCKDCHDGG